ncbi:MAG: hypothetical protein OXJ52_02280 [Oligoflexia bacterium]|nr:hypothetical protein [Oligoflexia bacterium]
MSFPILVRDSRFRGNDGQTGRSLYNTQNVGKKLKKALFFGNYVFSSQDYLIFKKTFSLSLSDLNFELYHNDRLYSPPFFP